jgi:trans-aconitate methyltransferase
LINYLIGTGGLEAVLEIIDLGAGTGANQRWLAPRLPFQQRWIHLDHDPAIIRSLPLPEDTVIIDGSVEALGRLLAGSASDHRLVA